MRLKFLLIFLAITGAGLSPAFASAQSAWSSFLQAEVYRGFDEYANVSQRAELNVLYKISSKNYIDSTFGYDYQINEYEGESQTEKNFQLEDLETLWMHQLTDENIRAPLFSVLIGTGLKLPTSETSQTASLQASWVNELTMSGQFVRVKTSPRFLSRLSWLLKNRLYLNAHTYDTADAMGTTYNSQWDILNVASLKYKIGRRLEMSISAGQMTSRLYSGRTQQVQFYSGSMNYSATKDLSIYLRGQTKDRIISNNSLFDDDNSQVGLGFTYEI